MQYWLMKSEPHVFSLDDLKARKSRRAAWTGVRNYQARNFMRDRMAVGDRVLYYHSSCPEPGVAGLAEIASRPYPDPTQFDPEDSYYDPKATEEKPRWMLVDVKYVGHFPTFVPLTRIKETASLADMLVVKRGQRLSIQPVEPKHFKTVCKLGGWDG
ncbi:MAG: EVE domain-containing protein [Opitutales bacterium]